MPTIKLFENWLADQPGQVNEAEPVKSTAVMTAQELASESTGKELGKPFASAKKGVLIVPSLDEDKSSVSFNIYSIEQNPETEVKYYTASFRTAVPITDNKVANLDVPPGDGGTGNPKFQPGVRVGTVIDLYANIKGSSPTLTPDEYLVMLDSFKPGYIKSIATASAKPDAKLIHIGTPGSADTANQTALIKAAVAKSEQTATAPTAAAPAAGAPVASK